MAIYNPPKGNNWGSILQTAGTTVAGVGGALTMTGAGAPVGIIAGAAGGIMAGVGALINNGQQMKQQNYDMNYQKRVAGENALNMSIGSIRELAGNKL